MRSVIGSGTVGCVLLLVAWEANAAAPKALKSVSSQARVVVEPKRVVSANLYATATIYRATVLEEMKLFEVADHIVKHFEAGTLPVGGKTEQRIHEYAKGGAGPLDASSRRRLYAHVLGDAKGTDAETNDDFAPLLARFVTAALALERAAGGSKLEAARKKTLHRWARELALNLSNRSYGAPTQLAPALSRQIELAQAILADPKIHTAYDADDTWHLVQKIAEAELDVRIDARTIHQRAEAGATIIRWLGDVAVPLSTQGGAPEEALDDAESRVPGAARTLKRTVTSKGDLRSAQERTEVRALCVDEKHRLAPCKIVLEKEPG